MTGTGRRRFPSCLPPSLRSARVVAATALLVLSVALALPAAAQADVLVSNVGLVGVGDTGGTTIDLKESAKGFSTGTNTGGYNLTSVEIGVGQVPSSIENLEVWILSSTTNAMGDPIPDVAAITLSNPTALSVGMNTFTAPTNTLLASNTTYFVFLRNHVASGNKLGMVTTDFIHGDLADDGTGLEGWGLLGGFNRNRGSTHAWVASELIAGRMQVRLNGSAVTTPGTPDAPTNFTAAPGNGQVVLSWDAPASGSGVTRHEYRFKTSADYPANWTQIANSAVGGANEDGFTVMGLTNETAHIFALRAVGAGGGGAAAYAGPVTLTPGVCGRTQQVQDAILDRLSGVDDCAAVTVADLASIGTLQTPGKNIASLQSGDFAGLTALTILHLYRNDLSSLPETVFSGLTNLTELHLRENELSSLPAGVFSGLTGLTTLRLGGNALSSLPETVFSGLTNLTELDLGENELSSLPAGVFSGLTSLDNLSLYGNELSSLPETVFSGLTNLTKLGLQSNALSSLPDGLFSGLTGLTTLRLHDNDLTSLPAGLFSGLAALIALSMNSNPNSGDTLPLTVTVEKVGTDQARAKVLAGAPFAVEFTATVANGTLDGDANTLGVAAGSVEGTPVTVTRTAGTTTAVMVDIDLTTQPTLPLNHRGYTFAKATSGLPAEILRASTRIRNVTVVNGPGSDGVWRAGERVELEVRYPEPVVVEQPECWDNGDGECRTPGPFVLVAFRSDARPGYGEVLSTPLVPYVGGSGTAMLRFAYTVGAAEDGARGVVAADDGMLLRGATIRTLEGGEGDSRYTSTRVMQVTVQASSGRAWTAGEKVRVRVRFTGPPQPYTPDTPPEERLDWDKVDVAGGTPTIRLLLGDRERRTLAHTASYVGGSGTNTLVFEYEVRAGDGRVGAVEVVAGSLARNGATIRNERGYDAELGHLSAVRYAQRPALSVADAEATEGEDATLDFVVKLDGNSGSEVKVDYRTRDGTAEAGSDYTETRGRLTFAPGEYEKTVSVPIRDDAVQDDGETFKLLLSNVSGAGVANDDYEATGTIEDVAPEAPSGGLTASFEGMPSKHNAKNAFTFRVAFSENIGISFRSLREDAFTVSGGRVTGGKRVDGRRDLFEMTVRPKSNGDVTITLQAGRACGVSGAICTKGENRRKLTNAPSATVRGPAAAEQKPQQQEQQRPDQETAAAAQEPQQQEQQQPEQEEEEQPQKPPPPPRNLTGVANDDGSVTLSWDAPGDDSVTGYRILRRHTVKQAPGVFSTLASNTGTTATTYTDRVASPETRYAYRVKAVNAAGAGKRSNYVKVTTKRAAPASKPALADGPPGLAPNMPNPFNASTVIPYRLDTDGPVRLEIYNLLGQSIRTLVDEVQAAGAYRVRWDARDGRGAGVATGVYFIRLHYPGGVHTRRMLYLE